MSSNHWITTTECSVLGVIIAEKTRKMQYKSNQTVNLHYQRFGQNKNPPLLILPGLFGSIANWRSIIRDLSEDFEVIAVDMRNHGQSPWADSMDYREMAEDIANLILTLKLPRPALLGHSMGGKIAMMLAQLDLISIGKLIVADIAPFSYQHSHQHLVTAMLQLDLVNSSSRSDVDAQLAETIAESGIRQFLLQNLKRVDDKYQWRINLQAIGNNMEILLGYSGSGTANHSTLFLAGENSDYITPNMQSDILSMFPKAEFKSIPDAGHWLHAEQPATFLRLTRNFLLHSTAP